MSRKPSVLQDHPVDFADAKAAGLYRAVCQYVVDGDTADFLIDLGLYQYAYGCGSSETTGIEKRNKGLAMW